MKRLALVLVPALMVALAPSASAATDAPQPAYVFHFAYSVVWVQDSTTSGMWPVKSVAAEWDKGTNVSVRYGPCRPDAACIKVSAETVAAPYNWGGVTWANENLLTHEITGADTVTLNDSWGQGATLHDRTAVTCHEMGHALGLMYHWPDASTGSCIVSVVDPNQSTVPNAQDRAYLNSVYPVPVATPPTAPPPVKRKPAPRSVGCWCAKAYGWAGGWRS